MNNIILLLRPKHWSKSLFLYIPVFFAGEIFNIAKLVNVTFGFFIFSAISSGIYIINDIKDVEADRLHPTKKNRPIANKTVSIRTAYIIASLLLLSSIFTSYILNIYFFYFIVAYLGFNLSYSFGLKHVAILDLFIVASGFVFRIFAGGILADVLVSHWLIVMVLLLSLFLVIAKRLEDLKISEENSTITRKSTANYNTEFIYACLTMLSAVMIVAYIMYTLSDDVTNRLGTNYLFITCVFVIAGIMRYLQKTIVEKDSGSPVEALYKDKFIILTILGWLMAFFIIIY